MPGTLFIIAAAPREIAAIASGLSQHGWAGLPEAGPGWTSRRGRIGAADAARDVVLVGSGVGMANAAAATGWVLGRRGERDLEHAAVLSLGIGGALPQGDAARGEPDPCAIGDVVLSEASIFADTGLRLPNDRFSTMGAVGFPLVPGDRPERLNGLDGLETSLPGLAALRAVLHSPHLRHGRIATVASCSSSDGAARAIVERTGAIAEAMEGAAVAVAAHTLGEAWGEVRVISNTTGDRDRQRWDLGASLDRLRTVAALVAAWWGTLEDLDDTPGPRSEN